MRVPAILGSIKKVTLAAMMESSSAISALWTFPSVVLSAFLIAWGAEAAQFLISQGLALAILAWLQTLPEFAVEAVIAWTAGQQPEKAHLMIANLTGSLRLLVGLGWPMIFFTAALVSRAKGNKFTKHIKLDDEHSVEVLALAPPIFYWLFIWSKASLNLLDACVLTFFYVVYLLILNKMPPQSEEKIDDMEYIPRMILRSKRRYRNLSIIGLFSAGGLILYFVAHPFLNSIIAIAVTFGFSEFIVVQWIAPFLSEFPEGLSALNWARQVRLAPMGLMNIVSSNINQWTMLAAMLPIVFSLSRGTVTPVVFDEHQRVEILLTIAQSFLGMMLLMNMRFSWYESVGIFSLWFIQFLIPETRETVTIIYFVWVLVEVFLALIRRRRLGALRIFPKLLRENW